MKVEVKIPSVGESIVSGILTIWLKKNNDIVNEEESILNWKQIRLMSKSPLPLRVRSKSWSKRGKRLRSDSLWLI